MFVEQLATAMRNRHQVVLVNYHSASSNDISDRIVEPIHFGDNYQSIIALDTKDKVCKQFKLDRIGDVIEKRVRFKFPDYHKENTTDIFGFTGKIKASVTLLLTLRAWLLLREEHPLAIPYTKQLDNGYEFKGPVSNYAGIARFVLGLLNEVTIVEPQEFKDYVKKLIQEQILVIG
jgi:predicted DNA-binding transcriptional regulator YafY